jgi:hypothetical protein
MDVEDAPDAFYGWQRTAVEMWVQRALFLTRNARPLTMLAFCDEVRGWNTRDELPPGVSAAAYAEHVCAALRADARLTYSENCGTFFASLPQLAAGDAAAARAGVPLLVWDAAPEVQAAVDVCVAEVEERAVLREPPLLAGTLRKCVMQCAPPGGYAVGDSTVGAASFFEHLHERLRGHPRLTLRAATGTKHRKRNSAYVLRGTAVWAAYVHDHAAAPFAPHDEPRDGDAEPAVPQEELPPPWRERDDAFMIFDDAAAGTAVAMDDDMMHAYLQHNMQPEEMHLSYGAHGHAAYIHDSGVASLQQMASVTLAAVHVGAAATATGSRLV